MRWGRVSPSGGDGTAHRLEGKEGERAQRPEGGGGGEVQRPEEVRRRLSPSGADEGGGAGGGGEVQRPERGRRVLRAPSLLSPPPQGGELPAGASVLQPPGG